ncbi:hypothetical protein [Pedobacter sp. MR2016-24]|uniref:hypothetical protein n=1 Tax=Pedobacter sp. MR2016-24 TaxID=2994466 RepID=UPI002247AE07|nr:hypothetical protein [Pedobacter sp. MR2016-24]MCX2485053.1 hypothetical protein [Pedobacter sp. MR2016-24]
MENKPYQFELDGVGEILIFPPNEVVDQYRIVADGMVWGYIYPEKLDDDTGEVIWKSDSSGLNIVAPVLGNMIERYEISLKTI